METLNIAVRDYQNSILSLTNKEGKSIESYSYDAFGNITQHTKTLETYNPYGYTGREADTDDLYYYRARYYDPTIGRFITPDPIGFAGGDTNFYRYVGNDPVNFVDPSGLLANMAGALAQLASINRGHSDGNPFNGIVPDTSLSKTVAPNSTLPQGKTNTQTNKLKTAQTTSKTAQTNKGDGTKIKGDVKPIVDEKCKDQKWFDPIKDPQLANYTKGGGKAPYWNVFGTGRKGKMHGGVDLLAMPKTLVYACVDGTISIGDMQPKPPQKVSYGKYILLKAKCPAFVRSQKKAYSLPYKKQGEMEKESEFTENGDLYFFYAHLLEVDEAIKKAFERGEKVEVKAGDKIGKTGTSGYDTSADPHLHFEIRSSNNLKKGSNNRANPGFYMKYKLPAELTSDESASQKEVAKKRQGDPSTLR
ncbi:MAG: peptidoglycan DD-metalloendopeptidase family protein [Sulfuricurvum sp.]|uniref:RHS repeat-associated core domain-containing protein n=1 Tax=Sulfuricurvum sp. TaxID=2025608 RepID=UPI00262EC148|nr:RHS repeat-associated core domain-containing protein [Sulfuricurvum sp.]MDD5160802.1 peptidoglycan DD-metalloendopeptidase family protein [Sulfuricurvum sp.]